MELRRTLGIALRDPMEIYVEDDGRIILKKYAPDCVFCNSADNVIEYMGKSCVKSALRV